MEWCRAFATASHTGEPTLQAHPHQFHQAASAHRLPSHRSGEKWRSPGRKLDFPRRQYRLVGSKLGKQYRCPASNRWLSQADPERLVHTTDLRESERRGGVSPTAQRRKHHIVSRRPGELSVQQAVPTFDEV